MTESVGAARLTRLLAEMVREAIVGGSPMWGDAVRHAERWAVDAMIGRQAREVVGVGVPCGTGDADPACDLLLGHRDVAVLAGRRQS
ncbi:hypothetical protein [Streptomyces canus]|uniref:hypothetical protein n=1 Tax=Streptomyces canus TaxID=58343 RepID=UPI002DDB9335|nr:hypothetical protein [Streptomyces canus]WSD92692.1 hypothetical protein OG925_51480 [Streptomyces canus]